MGFRYGTWTPRSSLEGGWTFVQVYFMITEVFGRFRIVAEASGVKSESPARNSEASVSDQHLEVLGSGTKWLVPE